MTRDETAMSNVFSHEALAKALHATPEDAIAAIPPGCTKAVIEGTYSKADGAGVTGEFVHRDADGNWGFTLGGGFTQQTGVFTGFKLVWSGK